MGWGLIWYPANYFIGTASPTSAIAGYLAGIFAATADPIAAFESVLVHGYFVAAADPLLTVTPGFIILTANPTAAFTGINNAYTQMGFTAPAYPHLDWVGLENQAIGVVLTAHPQLILFVPVGQSGRCASGEGMGHRDDEIPTNYVF